MFTSTKDLLESSLPMNEQDQPNHKIVSEIKLSFSNTLALLFNSRVSPTLTGQQIAALELLETLKKANQEIVLEEDLGGPEVKKIIAKITFDENGVNRVNFMYSKSTDWD